MAIKENGALDWRLTCFYGFPERERRRESWLFLKSLATLSSLPWCVMGDFNDLMYESDKAGRVPHPQYLLSGFCNTIEECHLTEIDLKGGNFTWERSRGSDAWVRERLDRSFGSLSWWSKFPLCHLSVIQTARSDHDPIFLELMRVEISKKEFRFRFENIWLKEPKFIDEIKSFWSSIPVVHLLPKLSEVSSYMAR